MNLFVALLIGVVAIIVLVAVLKLAFNLIVLAIGIGLALVAYFFAEKLIGKGK